MGPDFALWKFQRLQNLTKKNLLTITANTQSIIEPSSGLNNPTLIGKALGDIMGDDEHSYILPMLTNSLGPYEPFTSAIAIPYRKEVTAIGCLINCNHLYLSDKHELNKFSETLVSLGSLLVFYTGENLVSKSPAGFEKSTTPDSNPTL